MSSLLNRNFLLRTLSGAGLFVVVVGALLWSPYSMLALMAVLTAGSLAEFYRIARLKDVRPLTVYPVIIGLCALALTFLVRIEWLPAEAFALLLPMIFALFIAELYRKRENPLGNICWELGGLVYIVLPFALLIAISTQSLFFPGNVLYDPYRILCIIFIVWANDVGAYLTGSLLGRHKLFERISPKKSWEGFAGGLVCAVVIGGIFYSDFGHWDWFTAGAGLIVAVAGVFGDLVESMLKRSVGLKDSGNIIPGHGGFLDRFDALILAVPFVYAYFRIFAYICMLGAD